MRLLDKVAVITGAASGIGKGMAMRFAREGARVVVADIDRAGAIRVAQEISAQGKDAIAVAVDVSRADEVQSLIQTAVSRYGGIDIMMNNAGIEVSAPVADTEEELWDRVMAVNLKGVFLGSKAVWPHLVARGGGAIVNTASLAGLVGAPLLGAYAASKGGVIQLTRVLALEGARHHIRANALCPVFTETPMVDQMLTRSDDPVAAHQRLLRGIPLGRLGEADDVVGAALYLASDEASFITGVALPIDGGASAH